MLSSAVRRSCSASFSSLKETVRRFDFPKKIVQRSVTVSSQKTALQSVASLRCFSSSGGTSVETCAESLSRASDHIANQEVASDLAKRLSPQAREELIEHLAKTATTADVHVPQPSRHDLRLVALNQAIPFVGFGIMDNAILIIAGDAIDTSLGVLLGISTLCAAAIGNIISDVAGVMLGTVIEDFCAMLGLPVPNVTAAQRQLRSVRFANQLGCAIGIVIGCIIGMFPLLYIDPNKSQRLKQAKHMDQIFLDVVTEAKGLIGAEVTSLFLVVDSETSTNLSSTRNSTSGNQFLYAKYVGGKKSNEKGFRGLLTRGIAGRAALTGEAVNVYDARTEPDFEVDKMLLDKNHEVKNMLCVPVFDAKGGVIAVIQAINKVEQGITGKDKDSLLLDGSLKSGFTPADVQVLKALATHISVSLQNTREEENELGLRDTIRMLKDHGVAAILEENVNGRRNMHGRLPLFAD